MLRHDWTRAEAEALYRAPFNDLLFQAQTVHRRHFDPNQVQMSSLSVREDGRLPEDCAYCGQSAHHAPGSRPPSSWRSTRHRGGAQGEGDAGATRYCMGAAWKNPKERDLDAILAMVEGVKALGLETCMTLGKLTRAAHSGSRAGLDYYNHNIDTSERYYSEIVTTRTFGERLDTLDHVREAGIKVCCGGIVGMGEREDDRVDMLVTLANLPKHPESVPINMLIPIRAPRC